MLRHWTLAGFFLTFSLMAQSRELLAVASGEGDILIGPYLTAEREKRFAFMDLPFYEDNMVFYANANSDLRWDGSYTSLIGKRIVTIRGWAFGEQFDRESPNLSIEVTSTIESAMQMLAANRMDFLAVNERNAYREFAKPDIRSKVLKIAPPIGVQFGYIAFPKNAQHAALQNQFNIAYQNLIRNGQLAAMAAKYGGLVKIPSREKLKSR